MVDQPTGTITFLFTDIEGSTRLWERHQGPMENALRRHDALVRKAIEDARGYVFKTVGDAFCAAFASAGDAVTAVAAAQRSLGSEAWPHEAPIRVRMALHTGECEVRDGDYFGRAVNRVARLEATAHGGQVVVSRATAEVVRDRLPSDLRLVNLGPQRLKDLERPEDVFQLTVAGLPEDFPPLRSLASEHPTNLTEPVSSFVGRDVEAVEVVKLLAARRLVTLTGVGGVGKTRLATEVGRSLLSETEDGVWLVELATVSDPSLVAAEVLGDLGIVERPGSGALRSLVDVLASQKRLVILDNCEQVIDGCATLADAVVRSCPGITLLVTSREPLRIDAEAIYRVPSLSLPPAHVEDRTDVAGSGAVGLFVERASTRAPDFELTDGDAPLVASICRRLDGIPLAIELATARLRSMSTNRLHDRLEHRFNLLTGGSRVALPRQQTLRALVDWSYDLLTGPEQSLLRRTSVFVDGFDLEAAEGVCALEGVPEGDVADLLSSLVDKSLVVAEPQDDDVRYRLLETLREYGAEQLAEASGGEGTSEADRVAAAHAAYFFSLSERATPHLEGRSGMRWMVRLEAEDLNLRAAVEWALGHPEGVVRALQQFWFLQRYWRHARQPVQALALLDRALAQAGPDLDPTIEGRALYVKSRVLHNVDRGSVAGAAWAAVELARAAGDRSLEADALSFYSGGLFYLGRAEEALEAGAEAVVLAREIGDEVLLGSVLAIRAFGLYMADRPGAELLFTEALSLIETAGDTWTALSVRNDYSCYLIGQGDLAKARTHLTTALESARNGLAGSVSLFGSLSIYLCGNLGWVLLKEGDPRQAASLLIDALRPARLNGIATMVPYLVLALACCATQVNTSEVAAVLHGGADALLSATNGHWEPFESKVREDDIVVLRERLGGDFELHYSTGQAMAPNEIVKLALGRD